MHSIMHTRSLYKRYSGVVSFEQSPRKTMRKASLPCTSMTCSGVACSVMNQDITTRKIVCVIIIGPGNSEKSDETEVLTTVMIILI